MLSSPSTTAPSTGKSLNRFPAIFKEGQLLTQEVFEKQNAKWVEGLHLEPKVARKLKNIWEVGREEKWLGSYFQKEILSFKLPPVSLRWIDESIGWGVFADEPISSMQFIAEYSGVVRKRRRADSKNSYCFELIGGYIIDAQDQGALSRYLNHSSRPNLISAMAFVGDFFHVIFYTKRAIAKDEQLCYDYGPDYWSKRKAPEPL